MFDVLAAFCVPPIGEGILHLPFYESLLQVLAYDSAHDKRLAGVLSGAHAYIPENRNTIVRAFLAGDCEWLWWLDYDMVFNPDALDRLLAVALPGAHPVVSALYFNHIDVEGERMILPTWLDRVEGLGSTPILQVRTGELRECASVGMGCTVVHRSVFEKLDDPLLAWPWYGHEQLMDAEGHPMMAGEDVTFCMRARRAGFPIFGYGGVVCEHLKAQRVGIRQFLEQTPRERPVPGAPPAEVRQLEG